MELIKISDNYSIKDQTELWNITGNVRKDTSGVIQINISISEIDKTGYVGHFSYTINSDNNVIGSFDCNQNTDELLFQYANTLVDKIVEQLKKINNQ